MLVRHSDSLAILLINLSPQKCHRLHLVLRVNSNSLSASSEVDFVQNVEERDTRSAVEGEWEARLTGPGVHLMQHLFQFRRTTHVPHQTVPDPGRRFHRRGTRVGHDRDFGVSDLRPLQSSLELVIRFTH